ncbi:MAG: diguanylate cyclase [Dehalococcoidia bacterium]|jgi:diguanylate cyclase (GGDEF)-like protein
MPETTTEFGELKRYLLAALGLVSVSLTLTLIDRNWSVPNLALANLIIMSGVLGLCATTMYRMRSAEKGLVRTVSPAATDPVTGLPDEQYFWLRLREEHRRVRRYGSQASLAIIDVNNLASVNQQYGEECGDAVLRHIAEVLETTKRASDVVARLSDDEFALILLECDREGAATFVERLEHYVTRQPTSLTVNNQVISLWVGVCIGVATALEGETTAEELAARARRNLEGAKEGRDKRRERWTTAWP